MQEPTKPERPAIFRTPVKNLTKEEILSMPHLLREHENALIAYHKALDEYHRHLAVQQGQVYGRENAAA